ncbi:LysR substrate-binding domain-containing protein [Pseudoalteromonas sp. S16_S37]|uniref:LysR substrate-binding domain-containing protein n=1 Tax=Pseudoalteromonas sp. S16_S37 TaxID=2720228 RepID=UPI001680A2DD|nr:LysR substrate-binding domain-containing protein [Pseudoalteromonas sp. S16_S37]MBD1582555.1 LysR family transcriptional regulator [Pseudoalteromonas sp. S16_S37]
MYKELNHFTALRYVEAAARHHSYSLAAQELFVTQAAVSQQIRLLESHLGCKLFYRQGRGMKPTIQGERLAKSLSDSFEEIAQSVRKVTCEPLSGTLTVTTTQSFASMILIPNMWRFSEAYPDIAIRVLVSPNVEDIKHGDVDVAIRYGYTHFPDLEQEVVLEDQLVPLCSPAFAKKANLHNIENMSHCQLVYYSYNDYWQNWFNAAGIERGDNRSQWLEVTNMDFALGAVLTGHGIFLGSAVQAKHYLQQGMLVQPFDISCGPGVRYSFLHNPNSPRAARIKVFKKWLLSQLNNLNLG